MSRKFVPFKIGDMIRVIGRDGTNGPLKFNEIYEVIELTEENSQQGYDNHLLAVQPIVVRADSYETYKPFLGKIERVL